MKRWIDEIHWVPHVLAIEFKKVFAYRFDFWFQYLFGTFAELGVGGFLWWALFESTGAKELRGFTFTGVVYYIVFASSAHKIARGGERGYLAMDIYDGSLTRYLLYPLSFFVYKLVVHFTQILFGLFQLLITLGFAWLLFGPSGEPGLSPLSVLAGSFTCLLTGYLLFMIMACLEMVAFWQDVIWNLMAMLRFIMSLVGGALVPLTFFPEWGKTLARITPFPVMIDFPARVFLGRVSGEEWLASAGLILGWSVVFSVLARAIWRRGLRRYSGVGI